MNSLYWRIFLSFWLALTLILVGTVTVAVNVALQHRTERPWVQRGQLYAQAARAFETGGPQGLREWLTGLNFTEPFSRTFVVEPSGREMLGRPLPQSLYGPPDMDSAKDPNTDDAARTDPARPPIARPPIAPIGGALVLVNPDGSTYHVVVGPLRDKPRLFGELELPGVPAATLVIALVVSAAICFFLARYLASPVDRLRRATRQLAAGDLNVRVLPALKGRQDDLGRLAADLDTMAARLRSLLETKQQLLRDVSHELRSPLARLQLAVSLARRPGSEVERHLERIACEADRLEQLIARTLTLARLERPTQELERSPIDVGDLLKRIVADVMIEAEAQSCGVALDASPRLIVMGDAELLRSSFENVLRNAIRYSPAGGDVEVTARRVAADERTPSLEIVVEDSGPGVPEKDLTLIFEPFYRVGAARDRAHGGEGIGLAIAARAIALHGGTIEARNRPTGGLSVRITLPAVEESSVSVLPVVQNDPHRHEKDLQVEPR